MINPIFLLFDNYLEMIAMFAGCFVFVFVCCLLQYREEKDKEKRKDILFQWVVLDLLFAVSICIAVFFNSMLN